MSPSFLVKIVCYTWRPFTITLASSAIICAVLKSSGHTATSSDDASVMVKGLQV